MGRESSGSEGMQSSQSGQSEERGSAKSERAQDTKSGSMGEKSAQDAGKGERSKSMSSQNEKGANEKGAAGKDMKAEGREDRNNNRAEGKEDHDRTGNRAEGKEDRDRTGNRAEGRDNKAAGAKEEGRTTGQAAAGAKLSTEQRTRITTVIRGEHVAPVTNVNFSISVGTRVPREVGFHRLPSEIVTIYPEWRDYEFCLVREQIIVVDPRTLEIVAVLDA
jgi:hypothetical protein